MIIAPTPSRALSLESRLDARYFASPAVRIRTFLTGLEDVEVRVLGGSDGYATVSAPSRFKRTYAGPGEEYVSYLRPYDVFEYLPPEADRLSVTRTDNLENYLIKQNDLLQTCSGRNLGPVVGADSYLAQFALSHDMIRISIQSVSDRYYTLAFLQSPTGQHLLRGNLSGSVIDHITVDQVSAIGVPFFSSVFSEVARLMEEAALLREAARIRLHGLIGDFAATSPSSEVTEGIVGKWTQRAGGLEGRLDAAFHAPTVTSTRDRLIAKGGKPLGEFAETFIPGRYKRYYVSPSFGRPIVSGRQLLQSQPVNLRYIAARSFDSAEYKLGENMIAFGAEGRAEERMAQPALITGDRANWLANNHVMRVQPRPGVNPGWLYLAMVIPSVQIQVKACSSGSVVDAVNASDLNRVVLPPVDDARGDEAMQCWQQFAKASEIESLATDLIENAVQECTESVRA